MSILLLVLMVGTNLTESAGDLREFRDVQIKMGVRFEITVVGINEEEAFGAIENAFREIDRIERMISSWKSTSETSAINSSAGEHPVKVSPDLFGLVSRCLKVSELTRGAFDISFAGLNNLWDFKDQSRVPPTENAVLKAMKSVGWKKIHLDYHKQTVFLDYSGTRIGFGAIGKGFAANRAGKALEQLGIENFIIDAGGDLLVRGQNSKKEPWEVAIADPRVKGQLLLEIRLTNQAIVTSGDYESYFMFKGKRYGHILDPRTGFPAEGLISVTILCPDAELADALATSVFVLGPNEGMALINKLHNVEGVLIDNASRILFSSGLKNKFQNGG